MTRSTKVKIVIFFIVFFLCFVDLRPLFRQQKPTPTVITTPVVDTTRKGYKTGSCYDMENSLCYYIIFLNDNESQWNDSEKTKFTQKKFITSLNYLSAKANEYSVTISTEYNHSEVTGTYSGIVETEVVENGSQEDILNQVAQSCGFENPDEMNSHLKESLGVNQVAYLIVMNKDGRSYKYSYVNENNEKLEFCVFFDDSITFGESTCCATISHEILHLFGAEDYYNPYGDTPQREKLAKELYPDDIMMKIPKNVYDAQIGEYTAYSVGWTDTLPEECNNENWWK